MYAPRHKVPPQITADSLTRLARAPMKKLIQYAYINFEVNLLLVQSFLYFPLNKVNIQVNSTHVPKLFPFQFLIS